MAWLCAKPSIPSSLYRPCKFTNRKHRLSKINYSTACWLLKSRAPIVVVCAHGNVTGFSYRFKLLWIQRPYMKTDIQRDTRPTTTKTYERQAQLSVCIFFSLVICAQLTYTSGIAPGARTSSTRKPACPPCQPTNKRQPPKTQKQPTTNYQQPTTPVRNYRVGFANMQVNIYSNPLNERQCTLLYVCTCQIKLSF